MRNGFVVILCASGCCCSFSWLLSLKAMELQCVSDAHVTGRKRKAGYLYMRSTQERAEAQMQEQNGENAALREVVDRTA
jgi:hypothetical protein